MKLPGRFLVDANILLRFLSGEPASQAAAVRKLFLKAEAGEIILDIPPLIVAETYYVLLTFYSVDRKVAAEKLFFLSQKRGVKLREAQQVLSALHRLQTTNVDFADAYLAALAADENVAVATFDQDFKKFHDINRHEPQA